MPHTIEPVSVKHESKGSDGALRNRSVIPGIELILSLSRVAEDGQERPIVCTVETDHNKEILTPVGWTWLNGKPMVFAQNVGLQDEYMLLQRGVLSNRPDESHPLLHAEPVLGYDDEASSPDQAIHRLITPDGIFEAIHKGKVERVRIAYICRQLASQALVSEAELPEDTAHSLRLIA